MSRSILRVAAIFMAALGPVPGASVTAIAADFQGNIPPVRLADGAYTSPDGGFVVALPPLVAPGAKAEERQVSAVQFGVFFTDDIGNVYYILQTDNTRSKYDLEAIAAGYMINDALREKEVIPTERGSELRLAGVLPGSSPLVRVTKVKGKTTQQNIDLHQAMSLFVTDTLIYEVAAGVTATHQESDDEVFAIARQRLEDFLGGLLIKTPKLVGP